MKPTKDLFVQCNDGTAKLSPAQFEEMFCSQCKNRDCVRAGMAFSSWDKRILTQVDRLLENPNIVRQGDSSRWEGIVNLEVFQEPQTIETWGFPTKLSSEAVIVKEIEPTAPPREIPPPEPTAPPREAPPPEPTVISYNTPVQGFSLGAEVSREKKDNDPWAVTTTLPVGGKFKMGG